MAKPKTQYICLNCDNTFPRWSGRCPVCGEWNSLVENKESTAEIASGVIAADLTALKDLPEEKVQRIKTDNPEFDRVLGATDPGVVEGSVILMAGNPGVGKSTLLLQVASSIKGAFYFSAEESINQLKIRAERLGLKESQLQISTERRIANILKAVQENKPPFVVIDSIQTVFDETVPGTPGSLVQVRENCWRIQQLAKQLGTVMLVVGHVTKEGVVAGPKVLEHLVDVVLHLEGDRQTGLRVLRSSKNRYGSTEEVGIWRLTDRGFETVDDPGKLFASLITEDVPGRSLTVASEGTRAFIVEIQALATKTAFGYPKRTAQGIDLNRLNLLLAVLENRLSLPISQHDIYINVVGGFTLRDPGIDLSIAAAVYSALTKKLLPPDMVLNGEVGLLGEVRPPIDSQRRKKEADRLHYKPNKPLGSIKVLPTLFC